LLLPFSGAHPFSVSPRLLVPSSVPTTSVLPPGELRKQLEHRKASDRIFFLLPRLSGTHGAPSFVAHTTLENLLLEPTGHPNNTFLSSGPLRAEWDYYNAHWPGTFVPFIDLTRWLRFLLYCVAQGEGREPRGHPRP